MERQILIVDDNKDAANAMSRLLDLVGFDVLVAHSGAEALETIRTHKPKIVLLDIRMPEMDGYTVARKLREDPEFKDTVLVALTGFGQGEDKLRAQESGFNHHLTKPASLNDLKAIIGFYFD